MKRLTHSYAPFSTGNTCLGLRSRPDGKNDYAEKTLQTKTVDGH